jgi:hypothetical protein
MFTIFAGIKAISTYTTIGKKHSIGLGRIVYAVAGIIVVPTVYV